YWFLPPRDRRDAVARCKHDIFLISFSPLSPAEFPMNEQSHSAPSGIPALISLIVLLIADILFFIWSVQQHTAIGIISAILLGIVFLVCLGGFFTVAPNEGKVLQFFGNYVGTVRDAGPRWANPFYSKRSVSLR